MMRRSNTQVAVLRWVLLCVALNAIGQILFKVARVAQPGTSALSVFFHVETWAAFIVYGVSAACWLWVLSRAQLSVAYPLLSLTFPIVVALSAILFSEAISTMRWAGVGVIVVGVSLLSRT
ncbi:MAG: 4-amino-4-deoxy-L-arabinose-phospho-UDP flippase [Terriglobia bacterium]